MAINTVGVAGDRYGRLFQGIFWTTDLEEVREGDQVLIFSHLGTQYARLAGIDRDDLLSVAWLDPVGGPPSSREPPRGER